MMMEEFPKLLIVLGLGIALVGALWWGATRVLGGRELPGAFTFQSGGMTCVVPILVSIVGSIVLTIVLNVLLRLLNK